MNRLLSRALLLTLCACAPSVSFRVPASAVAELPLERKLTLLDAENELLAAVDARDAQEDRARAAGEARREAARRLREAEDAKAPVEVARAAKAEAESREQFAERDRELQRALARVADAELLLADAKFEASRAAEVEAAALTGAQNINIAAFALQVTSLEQNRAEQARKAKEAQAKADAARAAWDQARSGLAKLTYGAQGSAWVN